MKTSDLLHDTAHDIGIIKRNAQYLLAKENWNIQDTSSGYKETLLKAIIVSVIDLQSKLDKYYEESIVVLENKRINWSRKQFPKGTATSALDKLIEEIGEIKSDINNGVRNPVEYSDALMCLFDSGARQPVPIYPEEMFLNFGIKLEINFNREWKHNSDDTYSHVKK